MKPASGERDERPRTQTLPAAARVRSRRDFLAIQRVGRRLVAGRFLIVYDDRHTGGAQLGITVTRKIGNAVVRNRLKRSVREVFRRSRRRLGVRLVVIAREGAGALSAQEVARDLSPALLKIAGPDAGDPADPSREVPREVR